MYKTEGPLVAGDIFRISVSFGAVRYFRNDQLVYTSAVVSGSPLRFVAVQTDVSPGTSATVWRLAHHRSDVANDNDPSRIYFWYTARPNVSPDGRWVLFTSNWEKTLGPDPVAEPGGGFRQDVFLLRAR